MVCCLTAPSHYLNQCWLVISKVKWQSPEGNCTSATPLPSHQLLKLAWTLLFQNFIQISQGPMSLLWVITFLSLTWQHSLVDQSHQVSTVYSRLMVYGTVAPQLPELDPGIPPQSEQFHSGSSHSVGWTQGADEPRPVLRSTQQHASAYSPW